MAVPLLDLKAQYNSIKDEINSAVLNVIEKQRFILGDEVRGFEQDMCAFHNIKYAIGVASGTDALVLAVNACGITAGDEVITTPFTFVATTEAIIRSGARVIFADIDARTFNIDPSAIASKITSKTKAILVVHLYGRSCDMDPIMEIAQKKKLIVIEDVAQSIGARYKGRKVGTFGDISCFSFFPSKNLGCYGDGGMILTNSEHLAKQCRILRSHGYEKKYFSIMHGYNSRLDEIQAAVLRVKIKHLNKWTEMRRANAEKYRRLLMDCHDIKLPVESGDFRDVYYLYTISAKKRDELAKYLKEKDIGCEIYYPVPLHLQDAYRGLGYKKGDFPNAERACEEVLSIPMYPELTDAQIEEVSSLIKEFYA